jgi:capsular exopolysaccharide synthesis family protein
VQAASIRLIEPAKTPGRPFSPNKRGTLIAGVLAGLFMGVFLAFFREYMDNTIRSSDDVSDYLEIPVLGTIPVIESSTKTGDVIQRHSFSGSVVSESYHSLRTNLQFFETDNPIKTLLVTSAGPAEGKSTTVANLALTLVQTGKRVCIVDTDLRKPVQHRLFKRPNQLGLTSIFAGVLEKKKLIQTTGFHNLYLLPCGPIPPNPAELLASSKMVEAVRTLHKDFDHILFDSPPILLVSDSLVLSTLVDGVLLVIRAGLATIPTGRHALESLESVKANVVGGVLNQFDIKHSRYYGHYYSKYYRYGYGYGEKKRTGEKRRVGDKQRANDKPAGTVKETTNGKEAADEKESALPAGASKSS